MCRIRRFRRCGSQAAVPGEAAQTQTGVKTPLARFSLSALELLEGLGFRARAKGLGLRVWGLGLGV